MEGNGSMIQGSLVSKVIAGLVFLTVIGNFFFAITFT